MLGKALIPALGHIRSEVLEVRVYVARYEQRQQE